MFIAKYDNYGTPVWAKSAGKAPNVGNFVNSVTANAITVDDYGNSYITGEFSYVAFFSSTTLTCNGTPGFDTDVFVAMYNASGNLLWAKQGGGNFVDEGKGIAIAKGGCFVTGRFQTNSANFGGRVLSCNNGQSEAFIAYYDVQGTVIWAQQSVGQAGSNCISNAIASDIGSNCYITGSFFGVESFGSTTLTGTNSNGRFNAFVAKYTSTGKVAWVKQEGGIGQGSNSQFGKAITVAYNDKLVYAVGDYQANMKFSDGTSLTGVNANNCFIIGYDLNGGIQLKRQISATNGSIYAYGIASSHADPTNSFYVAGDYSASSVLFEDVLNSSSGITQNPAYYISFVGKYLNSAPLLTIQKNYNLYPNPASDEFSIQGESTQNDLLEVSVYDIDLKEKIYQSEFQVKTGAFDIKVNTSRWPTGTYYVKINSIEYGEVTERLLVDHDN